MMGPSGSGRSTLLNMIGGLDRPTKGTIRVGGRNGLLLAFHAELGLTVTSFCSWSSCGPWSSLALAKLVPTNGS